MPFVSSRLGPWSAAGEVAVQTGISYVVVRLSLWLLRPDVDGGPWWWPATGVAVAMLIRVPRRWWVWLIVGYGLATADALYSSEGFVSATVYAAGSTIELAVAAALITKVHGMPEGRGSAPPMRRAGDRPSEAWAEADASGAQRQALRLAVAILAAVGLAGAFVGGATAIGIGQAPPYGIFSDYIVSHALGLIVFGPLVLPAATSRRGWHGKRLETVAVGAAAAGIGLWVFVGSDLVGQPFLTLLPVIWAASRLNAARTCIVAVGLCALGGYSATRDWGSFRYITELGERHDAVQLSVGSIGVMALALVLVMRHRVQLAEVVRDRKETLRIAVRDALVGIYSIRFEKGRIGEIRDANTTFCAMLGYEPGELDGVSSRQLGLGPHYVERAGPDAIGEFDAWMASFARGEPEYFRRETQFYTKLGAQVWVEVSATRVQPLREPPFALVHVHDLTSRVEHQRRLEKMALHDALTGLPNRTLLFRRIATALGGGTSDTGAPSTDLDRDGIDNDVPSRAVASRPELGLLFVDLDGFKSINDTYGHAAGDAVLVAVAHRLAASVRPADTVARIGGDEYVILCEAITDRAELDDVAVRIRCALREPIDVPADATVVVRASIGTAIAEPGSTADTLIRLADSAMYRDKRIRGHAAAAPAASTGE